MLDLQQLCSPAELGLHFSCQLGLQILHPSSLNLFFPKFKRHLLGYIYIDLDPDSLQSVDYVESTKLADDKEALSGYYNFQDTVKLIKQVVHKRVEKDFYGWVDFKKEHYNITNAYYVRRKHLVQNNKKIQKYFKSTISMQSTGSGEDRNVREYFENKIKN